MRRYMIVFGLMAMSLGVLSCGNPSTKQLETNLEYDALYKSIRSENEEFLKARAQEDQLQAEKGLLAEAIEPVLPEFNPLEETRISISVQEETIHNVLFLIARNSGLNLVIEPGISLENRITISFEDASSALVVEKLLEAYDLAWEVKDNILYVQRWNERTFELDFVNVTSEVTTASGGDIFGNLGSEGASGELKGEFTLATTIGGTLEDDSLYGLILETVDAIINEASGNMQGGGGGGGGGGVSSDENGFFALDPLAGQLYVRTTPGKLRAVAKMLNNLKAKLSRQVVIDARILQVVLDDEWNLGIDWSYVDQRLSAGDSGSTFEFLSRSNKAFDQRNWADDKTILRMTGFTKGDIAINAAIEAMQTFGGVKTVANPHVRVRHGQPALFTSGESAKYVSAINREIDDNNKTTYSVETSTVFNGVMLGVICFVNDDNKIDMQVYPIKSEVDPSSLTRVTVTADDDQISLPKVEVKNVSTNVRVSDGDTIILGGLIDKVTGKTDTGVPGLAQVPGLGWLFKSRAQSERVRELVIIMNIRIVQ
ncbi:MSHA type pilus biogenesis protein MshL [Desulfobaculum xiamenense]|uniref:MSHA type pilus biogenesis protein MshL n=1 Tax=Desulfobaculum xiamenense TaxID=995050 RepID=A0A846QLD5_9BACT|nr:hypothetical protein [Desulfobaculum xiamenense]NJB67860.1 MSHA type pilus biogenesis protein MshL [Desulfobaculum xiamenense]